MGYLTNGLSFRTLREANINRLPQFRDAKGNLAHSHPTEGDWSPAEWLQATVGELGELANLMKKIRRGDFDIEDPAVAAEVRHELADVAIYLDILALQFDVDLGRAIREKFNIVSERVGAEVFIGDDDDWHRAP